MRRLFIFQQDALMAAIVNIAVNPLFACKMIAVYGSKYILF